MNGRDWLTEKGTTQTERNYNKSLQNNTNKIHELYSFKMKTFEVKDVLETNKFVLHIAKVSVQRYIAEF